jgi:hypothetical protein
VHSCTFSGATVAQPLKKFIVVLTRARHCSRILREIRVYTLSISADRALRSELGRGWNEILMCILRSLDVWALDAPKVTICSAREELQKHWFRVLVLRRKGSVISSCITLLLTFYMLTVASCCPFSLHIYEGRIVEPTRSRSTCYLKFLLWYAGIGYHYMTPELFLTQ